MRIPFPATWLFLFFAVVASPINAAVERLKIEPTYMPQLSPVMLMEGITQGKVVVAIEVSAEGKLTDFLVLAHTHPALARNCINALKLWKYVPARIDGVPVPVLTELTIHFSAEGVVISRNMMDLDDFMQRMVERRLALTRRPASALDSAPVVLTKVAPKYAREAEEQGVRGEVTVHFYIDEKGAVRMPSVEGEPHPYLAQQALDAVRVWRFTPATSRGKPVMVSARQNFSFAR